MLTELLPPSAAPEAPTTQRLLRDDLNSRELLAAIAGLAATPRPELGAHAG